MTTLKNFAAHVGLLSKAVAEFNRCDAANCDGSKVTTILAKLQQDVTTDIDFQEYANPDSTNPLEPTPLTGIDSICPDLKKSIAPKETGAQKSFFNDALKAYKECVEKTSSVKFLEEEEFPDISPVKYAKEFFELLGKRWGDETAAAETADIYVRKFSNPDNFLKALGALKDKMAKELNEEDKLPGAIKDNDEKLLARINDLKKKVDDLYNELSKVERPADAWLDKQKKDAIAWLKLKGVPSQLWAATVNATTYDDFITRKSLAEVEPILVKFLADDKKTKNKAAMEDFGKVIWDRDETLDDNKKALGKKIIDDLIKTKAVSPDEGQKILADCKEVNNHRGFKKLVENIKDQIVDKRPAEVEKLKKELGVHRFGDFGVSGDVSLKGGYAFSKTDNRDANGNPPAPGASTPAPQENGYLFSLYSDTTAQFWLSKNISLDANLSGAVSRGLSIVPEGKSDIWAPKPPGIGGSLYNANLALKYEDSWFALSLKTLLIDLDQRVTAGLSGLQNASRFDPIYTGGVTNVMGGQLMLKVKDIGDWLTIFSVVTVGKNQDVAFPALTVSDTKGTVVDMKLDAAIKATNKLTLYGQYHLLYASEAIMQTVSAGAVYNGRKKNEDKKESDGFVVEALGRYSLLKDGGTAFGAFASAAYWFNEHWGISTGFSFSRTNSTLVTNLAGSPIIGAPPSVKQMDIYSFREGLTYKPTDSWTLSLMIEQIMPKYDNSPVIITPVVLQIGKTF